MYIATWLWLTGMSLTSVHLGQENHSICHTALLPSIQFSFPHLSKFCPIKRPGQFLCSTNESSTNTEGPPIPPVCQRTVGEVVGSILGLCPLLMDTVLSCVWSHHSLNACHSLCVFLFFYKNVSHFGSGSTLMFSFWYITFTMTLCPNKGTHWDTQKSTVSIWGTEFKL